MDGIDEELGGDARFFLVLSESEQTNPWDEDYGRVCVAQLGRVCGGKPIVVLLVVDAILLRLLLNVALQHIRIFGLRDPWDKHGTYSSAQEVIRATGA